MPDGFGTYWGLERNFISNCRRWLAVNASIYVILIDHCISLGLSYYLSKLDTASLSRPTAVLIN